MTRQLGADSTEEHTFATPITFFANPNYTLAVYCSWDSSSDNVTIQANITGYYEDVE